MTYPLRYPWYINLNNNSKQCDSLMKSRTGKDYNYTGLLKLLWYYYDSLYYHKYGQPTPLPPRLMTMSNMKEYFNIGDTDLLMVAMVISIGDDIPVISVDIDDCGYDLLAKYDWADAIRKPSNGKNGFWLYKEQDKRFMFYRELKQHKTQSLKHVLLLLRPVKVINWFVDRDRLIINKTMGEPIVLNDLLLNGGNECGRIYNKRILYEIIPRTVGYDTIRAAIERTDFQLIKLFRIIYPGSCKDMMSILLRENKEFVFNAFNNIHLPSLYNVSTSSYYSAWLDYEQFLMRCYGLKANNYSLWTPFINGCRINTGDESGMKTMLFSDSHFKKEYWNDMLHVSHIIKDHNKDISFYKDYKVSRIYNPYCPDEETCSNITGIECFDKLMFTKLLLNGSSFVIQNKRDDINYNIGSWVSVCATKLSRKRKLTSTDTLPSCDECNKLFKTCNIVGLYFDNVSIKAIACLMTSGLTGTKLSDMIDQNIFSKYNTDSVLCHISKLKDKTMGKKEDLINNDLHNLTDIVNDFFNPQSTYETVYREKKPVEQTKNKAIVDHKGCCLIHNTNTVYIMHETGYTQPFQIVNKFKNDKCCNITTSSVFQRSGIAQRTTVNTGDIKSIICGEIEIRLHNLLHSQNIERTLISIIPGRRIVNNNFCISIQGAMNTRCALKKVVENKAGIIMRLFPGILCTSKINIDAWSCNLPKKLFCKGKNSVMMRSTLFRSGTVQLPKGLFPYTLQTHVDKIFSSVVEPAFEIDYDLRDLQMACERSCSGQINFHTSRFMETFWFLLLSYSSRDSTELRNILMKSIIHGNAFLFSKHQVASSGGKCTNAIFGKSKIKMLDKVIKTMSDNTVCEEDDILSGKNKNYKSRNGSFLYTVADNPKNKKLLQMVYSGLKSRHYFDGKPETEELFRNILDRYLSTQR